MSPWSLMLRMIRFRPFFFLFNCTVWTIHHTLPLVTGLLVKLIFDTLQGVTASGLSIWYLLGLVLLVDFLRMGILGGGNWIWFTLELSMCALLRRNILESLVTGPGARVLPNTPGESLSRLRDDVREVVLYFEYWVDFLGYALFTLAALFIMLRVDVLLTALVLIPLVGIFFSAHRMSGLIRKFRRRLREATGQVTSFLGETFDAIGAIKVAGAEKSMLAAFQERNQTRRERALKDVLFSETYDSLNQNMAHIGIGMMLLVAGLRIRTQNFSVGDFALFIAYLPRITELMSFFGKMLAQHRRTEVSFARMRGLVKQGSGEAVARKASLALDGRFPSLPEITRRPQDRLISFEVQGLTYRYPDTQQGIRNVTLRVERGSLVVITGRIGSGKTTLLKCLLGLLPHHEGRFLWNGKVVEDPSTFLVPPRSAYAPQLPTLFSDQLQNNILLGNLAQTKALPLAIRRAALDRDVEQLEHGLQTEVGPRGAKLSGGQIQRSSAARMFIQEPELLVIDDFASALDVHTERRLWEPLLDKNCPTCMVATHSMHVLKAADHILVLKHGEVVGQGPLTILLETCKEMKILWERSRKEIAE